MSLLFTPLGEDSPQAIKVSEEFTPSNLVYKNIIVLALTGH